MHYETRVVHGASLNQQAREDQQGVYVIHIATTTYWIVVVTRSTNDVLQHHAPQIYQTEWSKFRREWISTVTKGIFMLEFTVDF